MWGGKNEDRSQVSITDLHKNVSTVFGPLKHNCENCVSIEWLYAIQKCVFSSRVGSFQAAVLNFSRFIFTAPTAIAATEALLRRFLISITYLYLRVFYSLQHNICRRLEAPPPRFCSEVLTAAFLCCFQSIITEIKSPGISPHASIIPPLHKSLHQNPTLLTVTLLNLWLLGHFVPWTATVVVWMQRKMTVEDYRSCPHCISVLSLMHEKLFGAEVHLF